MDIYQSPKFLKVGGVVGSRGVIVSLGSFCVTPPPSNKTKGLVFQIIPPSFVKLAN
jgi:hypothetical protein